MSASPAPPLSDEQRRVVDRAASGDALAVTARAGSGKTHTLLAVTSRTAPTPTLFLAFNRAIAREAAARVPAHVRATTLHALAFKHVVAGHARFERKFRSANGTLPLATLADLADLSRNDPGRWTHVQHLRSVFAAFAADGTDVPEASHVPEAVRADLIATLGRERAADRIRWLSRRAARAWRRIADPDDDAPLNHDAYLKLFALARPTLPAELLLVDEAQDLAPVMLTLLDDAAARQLLVGDPAQRIYAWRGAVDAMAASGLPETRLTRSFRFGPEIAAVARRILTVIDRRPRLSGSGAAGSVRTAPEAAQRPCTVLCRTNAGVLEAALAFGEGGVHVVGGVAETVRLLRAAYALWAGRGRSRPPDGRRNGPGRPQGPCGTDGPAHPELAGLNTWDALVEAAERRRGALSMLRTRVEAYGHDTPALCRALERAHLPREADAPVVLSTAHKAKGREWDHVTLWHDFPRVPTDAQALRAAPDREAARSELNLLYVGVTRARRTLDLARLREDLCTWLATPTEPSTAMEGGASASVPG